MDKFLSIPKMGSEMSCCTSCALDQTCHGVSTKRQGNDVLCVMNSESGDKLIANPGFDYYKKGNFEIVSYVLNIYK